MGETEPAPEACTGSADNAGPMQVDSAEGLVGGEEEPPEQELPQDGETEPAPEACTGSADNAGPMQVDSAEGLVGGEEEPPEQELPQVSLSGGDGDPGTRAAEEGKSESSPEADLGQQSGPEHATEEKTATEFAEGAQEGTIKDHLPQASLSGEDGETEPAPEACTGSADNAGPMQVDSAEGLVGGEEEPPEQELPQVSLSGGDGDPGTRAAEEGKSESSPEADLVSAEKAEPM
ncbi:UNVERIFIED_CONTAM: hypothetical protein FKN15_009946 [Acipenser sinensis]